MNSSRKSLKLVILAILSTISFLLMFLNFPLPFLPPYLKIDFSDVPAIMATFIFSPIAGIIVEGLKNGLHLIYTGVSDPIGVAANFLAGVMFVVPVGILYHKFKTVKSVVSGLIASTVVMAIGMSVLNYFVVLPAYAWFVEAPDMALPAVKLSTVFIGILPFNAIKGIVVALLLVPLFIKLKPWIEKKRLSLN
ncbi:ECF transporter S component [Salirhabdus sp. Marseille-P4669]|uniref:ECF transporter S component n=1 Tax=Salirhabdus sp. Marseille-P4669 TaxID=2042310 RepID=UPI000C7D0BDE|nr:ECF transporter S component [Salirhabdus sp. Marseille-P4669]